MKFLMLGLLFPCLAVAEYRADFFELGSGKTKKIYSMAITEAPEGDLVKVTSTITDASQQVVQVETTWLKGDQIHKIELDQKQLGAQARIEVGEKEVKFSKTIDSKTKEDSEKRKDTFVATLNFQKFVRSRWADIAAGKNVEFRYAVWDRMETIGFAIKKTGGEGDHVILTMKPSSMIIAALVNPLEFKWAADGSRLLEMKGRIAPKKKEGAKWKDQDAEVVYFYPSK